MNFEIFESVSINSLKHAWFASFAEVKQLKKLTILESKDFATHSLPHADMGLERGGGGDGGKGREGGEGGDGGEGGEGGEVER